MRNLGKSKKKRWRSCGGDIAERIILEDKKNNDNFFLNKKLAKNPVLKGNKSSAKPLSDIPVEKDGFVIAKHPIFTATVRRKPNYKDLWNDNGTVPQAKISSTKSSAIPLPGQSYNPSITDHFSMLSALATCEEKKKKEEDRLAKFTRSLRGVQSSDYAAADAKSFLEFLRHGQDIDNSIPAGSETIIPKKKVKKVNVKKRRAVELENIPKLMKEIRSEKRQLSEKQNRKIARKASRIALRKINWDISFQLPNEIAPSLRKLVPCGNLLSEAESLRNKSKKSRRIRIPVTKRTSFDRRGRKD